MSDSPRIAPDGAISVEIEVLEARREVTDLSVASAETLELAFGELAERFPRQRLTFLAFVPAAAALQALLALERARSAMPEITARALLSLPGLTPVVRLGGFRPETAGDAVAVRPAARAAALIDAGGRLVEGALAPEEPALVVGFARGDGGGIAPPRLAPRLLGAALEEAHFLAGPALAFPPAEPRAPRKTTAPRNTARRGPPGEAPDPAALLILRRAAAIRGETYPEPPGALAPLLDLKSIGAFPLYLHALAEGRESPELAAFFEREEREFSRSSYEVTVLNESKRDSLTAKQYAIIIADKFGSARAAALADKTAAAILRTLKPREAEIVQTEFKNLQKLQDAYLHNKCPHLKPLRRFLNARNKFDSSAALADLAEFFARAPAKQLHSDWIMCRSCDQRVICPHVRIRTEMEFKGAAYDAIRGKLLAFATRIRRGEDSYAYFCQICGGLLAENIDSEEAGDLSRFGNLDAELRSKLWGDAARATEQVRFDLLTDPRQFTGALLDAIYPLLIEATSRRAKGGLMAANLSGAPPDPDEVDPRYRLTAVLLVYAYVLNLIQSAGGRLGFADVKAGAKISTYADAIIKFVATTYGGLIARVEDLSADLLVRRFQDSFRAVRGEAGDVAVRTADPVAEFATQVADLDPAFHYASNIARSVGALPISVPDTPGALEKDARAELVIVLGVDLPDLVKNARKLAGEPEFAPILARKGVLEFASDKTLNEVLKNPKINLYAKIFSAAEFYSPRDLEAIKAFRALRPSSKDDAEGLLDAKGLDAEGLDAKEVKGGQKTGAARAPFRASLPPGKDRLRLLEHGYRLRSYWLFALYASRPFDYGKPNDFSAHSAELRSCERVLLDLKRRESLPLFTSFGFSGSRRFELVPVPLGAIYDENGAVHRWTVYVYSGGSAAPSDVKCAVCGALKSEASRLDPAKIVRSLAIGARLDMFVSFYESRCPAEGLHSFGSGTCSKCGFEERFTRGPAKNTSELRAFYEKYEAVFEKQRELLLFRAAEDLPPTPEHADFTAWAEEWQPEFKYLTRAAEIGETSLPVIEALGATERRDFTAIREGKDENPPAPPTAHSDPRIANVESAVLVFAGAYSRLRRAPKAARLAAETADLLERAQFPRADYLQLAGLPDVLDDFPEKMRALSARRAPAVALQFAIEQVCRMAVRLHDLVPTEINAPAPLAAVLREFARSQLKATIRSGQLLAKPGAFNFSIFSEAPPEDFDTAGDVGEDVLEAIADDEGKNGSTFDNFNPFSYEHMDYDGAND